jgi:mannose-6-phosphate isomerase-like protein (cupin superfamily)
MQEQAESSPLRFLAALGLALALPCPAPAQPAAPPLAITTSDGWRHDAAEPVTNESIGLSIDRYIHSADKSPAKISHDTMYVQRIFSEGTPDTASAGTVLLPGQETHLATLLPREVTSLYKFPKQLLFYVESGKGRLDDGKKSWELQEGSVMMVPPNLGHRFRNSGDEPLKMIMFSYEPGLGWPVRKDILVRDYHKILMYQRNVHWAHNAKRVIDQSDGSGGIIALVITFGPMTAAGAHVDLLNPNPYKVPTQWIHVTNGKMLIQLGDEIRNWPINTGFVNPANGQTVHNRINLSDKVETMLYIGGPGAYTPAPNGGRPLIALPGRPLGQGLMGQIWRPDQIGGLQGQVNDPAIDKSYIDSIDPGTPLRAARK